MAAGRRRPPIPSAARPQFGDRLSKPEHPTSIRLPRELKRELQEEAKAARHPLSLLIVHILEQWLAWRKKDKK